MLKKVRVSTGDSKAVPTKIDASASESSGEELSSDSDSGLDEIAGESSNEELSSSEDENDEFPLDESDDEAAPAGNSKFDDAMTAILGSKIKAHDRDNPVLIRNKRMAKEIEEAKLDAKARRQLRVEKLQSQDKSRVKNIIPRDPDEAGRALQQEKRYKKTAQRGVVRLMNALQASQTAASSTMAKTNSIGVDKKTQEVTTASKDSFLDMIRSG